MADLPKAVQQQVEAAEALLAASNQPQSQDAQTEAATPPTAPQTEPTTAKAPEPAQPQQSQDDAWERRYRTLQGLFNSEVPKLQQQNKDLSAKLQDAIARMDKLAQQPAQAPQPQSLEADPKDVDDFGSDLVEMVQRQTQRAITSIAAKVDSVVASFEARLKVVEQQLKGTTQTVAYTAEEVFFNKLAAVVPDWEQINSSDAFLQWLADVDPVYGQPRQAALTAAQSNLDVARVAAVFNAFKGAQPKTSKAQDALAKQVSPKTAASVAPTPTEKTIVTQAQIQAFYKDVATGKYRGRDAEVAQFEAVINEAIAEGRVR